MNRQCLTRTLGMVGTSASHMCRGSVSAMHRSALHRARNDNYVDRCNNCGDIRPMLLAPPRDRLIVALDLPGVADAEATIVRLGSSVTFYKIGLQLIFAGGI